ncbi:MAG: hypothetical protein PHP42_05175 [Bacteroidota bacterium]|nr:hypothetical protein [Bacteroidota bacterium]
MKRTINLYALVSLTLGFMLASCSSTKETTEPDAAKLKVTKPLTSTFKFLSINTLHQLQDSAEVKKFARWVNSTGAEVVAIQQIERATETKPGFDAVAKLARQLDMRSFFGKARYFKGWDSGNALFSSYPINQTQLYQLPVGKGKVRRSLAFGLVDLGLKQLGFCSTELDDENLTERMKQASEISSVTESLKDYPVVVAGNFGETAEGKTVETMIKKFSLVNTVNDETKNINEHVYIPINGKLKIVSAEKLQYAAFHSTGVLVTIEIIQ